MQIATKQAKQSYPGLSHPILDFRVMLSHNAVDKMWRIKL